LIVCDGFDIVLPKYHPGGSNQIFTAWNRGKFCVSVRGGQDRQFKR
jgi:hypothetical protein